jgi:hypothetical protein
MDGKRKTAQRIDRGPLEGFDSVAGYLSAFSKPRPCPMLEVQQAGQQAVPEMRILNMTEVYEKMSRIARAIGKAVNFGANC